MTNRVAPTNGLVIKQNTTLQPGTYHLPAGLVINSDEVVLDGQGAVLIGENKSGRGITLRNCQKVTLKNLRLLNYYHGIYAENCQKLTITGCQVASTAEVTPNTIFLDIWRPAEQAYGSGIFLWKVSHSQIQHNDLQHQMNGLLSYQCHHLEVQNNIANYCSGFGFHLFETRHSLFSQNYADYCCRYHPIEESAGHLGADAAGFLLVHNSCHNIFRRNYARLGGDGFFLAGLTPDGAHVDCSHNLFEENDGSYSPNNAFEATFSRGNEFRRNKANYSNYGFWLGFSRDNVLEDNQVWGNRQAGIAVENGLNMKAQGNDFRHNQYGILLWSKYVASFARAVPENDTSREWQIENNVFLHNEKAIRIAANQHHGVRSLPRNRSLAPMPHHHGIRRNRIQENRVGIELDSVGETVIEKNDMHNNLLGDIVRIDETYRIS
jgi:parallel beta-helix repeat protein